MNILLDCGANIGQGFSKLEKQLGINSTWLVYCFEPNPNCISFLKEYTRVENIEQKAVWIKDEQRLLILENNLVEVQKVHNIDAEWIGGCTNILDSKDFIKPRHLKKHNFKFNGLVDCIDFSKFVKSICQPDDKVYLKMDIEGAEFVVLDKMIKDKTILLIDEIFIEWHERMIRKTINRQPYIDYFKANGIKYNEWD
jgi:FkbM family methyltransferase